VTRPFRLSSSESEHHPDDATDMADKPDFDFASAFRQLSEAQQQIDAAAKTIVEGVQRMIDVVTDEAPSNRAALAGRDFSWHEGVARMLSDDGFGAPEAFEPRAWMSQAIETRALAEYAIGDGGTVIANWFALPPKGARPEHRVVVLSSISEDGHSFTTTHNGARSNLSHPPTTHADYVEPQLSLRDVLIRHRAAVAHHGTPMRRFADVASYHAARTEVSERTANFRRDQGLGLVERYIRANFQGENADVGEAYLQAIRAHPEWYAYADRGRATPEPEPVRTPADSGAHAARMPLVFLMSEGESGRRTITTFGMLFAGLPELLASEIAANHCRAARFLLGTVSRAIARQRQEAGDESALLAALVSTAGATVTLTAQDVVADEPDAPSPGSAAPVVVHVARRGFTADDAPALLGVDPLPGTAGSLDERLRAACRQLGHDTPPGRSAESMEEAMQDAHMQAVARLPDMKRRFQSGLGAGERLCVKTRRAVSDDVGEYIWLEVHGWTDRDLSGEVITPAPRINVAAGQQLTIGEDRVFDYLVAGPDGILEPSRTDQVAGDYGLDI
jgi:hypothetical protein